MVYGVLALSCASKTQHDTLMDSLTDLQQEDVLLLFLFSPGECIKCEIAAETLFNWVGQRSLSGMRIRTAAAISCNREIEVQAYAKRYPKYEVVVQLTEELRSSLGASITTRLVILNTQGDVIGRMNDSEFFESPNVALAHILRNYSVVSSTSSP